MMLVVQQKVTLRILSKNIWQILDKTGEEGRFVDAIVSTLICGVCSVSNVGLDNKVD